MAQGFLVSCVPNKAKIKDKNLRLRLLKREPAACRFLLQYLDPAIPNPSVEVKVFNSNGFYEQTFYNQAAVDYLFSYCNSSWEPKWEVKGSKT